MLFLTILLKTFAIYLFFNLIDKKNYSNWKKKIFFITFKINVQQTFTES